jgi:hypothetical protein
LEGSKPPGGGIIRPPPLPAAGEKWPEWPEMAGNAISARGQRGGHGNGASGAVVLVTATAAVSAEPRPPTIAPRAGATANRRAVWRVNFFRLL